MAVRARPEENVRECHPQPHRLPLRALLPPGHWWYCYRYRRGTFTGTEGTGTVTEGHRYRYRARPEEDIRECHPQPHRLPLRALLPPGHWWYCYRYRRGIVTGTEGHSHRYMWAQVQVQGQPEEDV
jgi:hypothetical protein